MAFVVEHKVRQNKQNKGKAQKIHKTQNIKHDYDLIHNFIRLFGQKYSLQKQRNT